MRLRNRHFNARHAGASLVLDSRFIDQADNSEVSSWADRSTNAHTIQQTTQANRPTFQTAEMNGNPVVRFDGSNDFLDGGDILDIGSNSMINMVTAKRTTGSAAGLSQKSSARGLIGRWALARSGNAYLGIYNSQVTTFDASVAESSTSPRIYTHTIERSTASRLRFDGKQEASVTITGTDTASHNTSDPYYVGAYGNASGNGPLSGLYFNGDIAQVVVLFTSSFSSSVLKRLEHAAAYSFKISCN